MHRTRWSVIAALSASLPTAATGAQPYSIDSFTIDGGGARLTGSTYTLSGTVGQPDTGVLTGTSFSISGGFWADAVEFSCNPADVAEPFGVLDLSDINVFVSAFVSFDPVADLNNDGIFDLSDLGGFVTAFLTGCP